MTDFELLRRWEGGDLDAGNELFERHFDAVHRFFANKAPSDAADLVQRTFLALLEALERFRQESSFRTFLFAIAHHELMAHWRSRSRVELKSSLSSVLDLDPSPSALITRVAEERHLLEALRSIPIELQVALELFYWEGLTGPELAVVLSVPEGTARSRLRRGLELLRQRLDHLEHGPERLGSTLASLDGWARAMVAALLEQPAD
ncbi:MAG: sigma-70 family RNA polymerase sigma factor [Myxococcales bacterium]|nr:sigma-70 family RNA polymerase sigma factor [Myxococcales bacterium]